MSKKRYKIQDDDIILDAYPKSGNNFLLFFLTELLYQKKMDWATKGEMIQSIYKESVENLPSPHLVWSHESFNASYPKVIYLVRDPRDIVISYYHHRLKYYSILSSFNKFFEKFIRGKVWPGKWDSHVESWLANQKKIKNGFLLIKYEDLLENPPKEAQRLINFLNLTRTEEEINEAINWASFDNMKALEQRQKDYLNGKLPNVNKDMYFVREGKANKWKSILNKEQVQKVNQEFYKTLTTLGYDL